MGQILTHIKKYFCKKKKKKEKRKRKSKISYLNSQQLVGKRDRLVPPFQIPGFKFSTYASYPQVRTSACAYQEVNVDFSKNLCVRTK